jgi:pimeloyl-ACP methyl ester carboxylesterase
MAATVGPFPVETSSIEQRRSANSVSPAGVSFTGTAKRIVGCWARWVQAFTPGTSARQRALRSGFALSALRMVFEETPVRCRATSSELQLFDGAHITVPACYIAGAADWGIYQSPGAFERMQQEVCTRMSGVHLLSGAGHWVQQEQPVKVNSLLLEFLRYAADKDRG